MLHLTLAGMAVFATEIVNGIKIVFVLYNGLCIEQRFAVLTLRGARLKFKKYSVCLTWHNELFSNNGANIVNFAELSLYLQPIVTIMRKYLCKVAMDIMVKNTMTER
jgi:hypothetical protein